MKKEVIHIEREIHKTKKINVCGQMVDVDVKIIPLVEWFNSNKGISTTYCCQGSKDGNDHPYVGWNGGNAFYKKMQATLKAFSRERGVINLILDKMVNIANGAETTCYAIYFPDTEAMLSFTRYVKIAYSS